jgi:hypothetical protein
MLSYFVDLGGKAQKQPIKNVDFVPPLIDPARPNFGLIRATVHETLWPKKVTPSPKP